MLQSQWIGLTVVFVCAILASLLVVVETALTGSSRGRVEKLVESGACEAERVRLIVQDPAPSISAVMFTRTSFEAMAMAPVALVVFQNIEGTVPQLVTLAAILLVVFFILWGMAPRMIGRQRPERIMRPFTLLVSLPTTALGPVAQLMILLGSALTSGRELSDDPFASEAKLWDLVDIAKANKVIEACESKTIHSVFEPGDTLVKEVMIPRTGMVWVPRDRILRQLLSLALRSGFPCIPVVGDGSIDDVLGVVYLRGVARRVYDYPDVECSETVGNLIRPASFVPGSRLVSELLCDMQLWHSYLVIVIDEFDGTTSLYMMGDIVEEIVGEIVDEYDHEIPAIAELPEPGHCRVSSRLPVGELGELFGIPLQDEEVDTVGGLVAKFFNAVPIPGFSVIYESIEMVADRAVGRRHQIGAVLVCLAPKTPQEEKEETSD